MPRYTTAEKLTRARLFVKGARQANAGRSTHAIDNRLDRMEERRRDIEAREADAALVRVDQARTQSAVANVALQAARPKDRQAAKRAARSADEVLRRAERAARDYL